MAESADILLRLPPTQRPAWALFDAEWYLRAHPELPCGSNPDALLDHYLAIGARQGHSPSPLFDEAFYLARNPDVAVLVAEGDYRSGFDHFCQFGHRGLSPHWLFDDTLYGELYPDMALDNLDKFNIRGRYDHWLSWGQRELRLSHFLFDGNLYRKQVEEAGGNLARLDELGPFVHYLYTLGTGAAELPASPYFDPDWYLAAHEQAREDIAGGRASNALHHYITSGEAAGLDPVAEFSESYHLDTYDDIAAAVQAGALRSGFHHFLRYGALELRRPRADIDLVYYRDTHARVRADLEAGTVRDAFAHLRLIGLKEGLGHCPPERVPDLPESATRQLFELRARNHAALFARQRIDFTVTGTPDVAVIMVVHNKFDLTMQALASLRANFAGQIELVLVDNGSTDATTRIETFLRGAHIIHDPENPGFLLACNRALRHVTAQAVLYLNNDIELGYAAIATALRRLATAATIGAVGGKVIRTHAHLQEAGSIIWADGSTQGYLRDASPLAPEANFVRDVDFCSGVFLLCRTDLVQRLGGFDEDYKPAYYEEVDLCVRMIEAGFRIVYDPDVTIHHLEYGSSANTEAAARLMRRGRRVFVEKHAAFLRRQADAKTPGSAVRARARNGAGRRLLFIEDTVPVRHLGSGFVRANDVVHAIAAAGWQVSVLPINGARHDLMSQFGDLPETAEVLHDQTILTLPALLADRPGFYDALWISRAHNLTRIAPILAKAGIDPAKTPFVLDTEAVAATREAEAAALRGDNDFDLTAAINAEIGEARVCRHLTAVNEAEAALLRGVGLPSVSVLGTIRDLAPTPRPFAEREGLLFIGSIHREDSPNLDSLRWYRDEILPALRKVMDNPPRLTFIGYTAPDLDLAELENIPGLTLRGMVADLRPAFDEHRLFIAPTRFAAGTPYKVYETVSYGLPCVATELLCRQLGWTEGQEIAAVPGNDAAAFARQIASLYRSEPQWTAMRDAGLRRLAAENSRGPFEAEVRRILASIAT
ncbi:glycosyltransferase [Acidiphilium sp. C61]|jgi:GT2 family glycosyltransferase|uniref:glycosyltransferase n=1 Tax=Acidiphilium sp. C61 TaxID=1671485 RepID=UPI00157A7FBE|nr:glycosyltransferase [Acidiphilium sp. C61]